MNKIFNILRSEIISRQSIIDLYDSNPHNQAVTKQTAEIARETITELRQAIDIINAANNHRIIINALHKLHGDVSLLSIIDTKNILDQIEHIITLTSGVK